MNYSYLMSYITRRICMYTDSRGQLWSRDQNLTYIYKGVADWYTESGWGIIGLVTKHDAIQYRKRYCWTWFWTSWKCAAPVQNQFHLCL